MSISFIRTVLLLASLWASETIFAYDILGGSFDQHTGEMRLEVQNQSSGIRGEVAHPVLIGGCFDPVYRQCLFTVDVLNSLGRMALEQRRIEMNLFEPFRSRKRRLPDEFGHLFMAEKFSGDYLEDEKDLIKPEKRAQLTKNGQTPLNFFNYLQATYKLIGGPLRITILGEKGSSFSFSHDL